MHGWVHCTIIQQYFAEFHKLVDLNGLVVVVIEFETDFCDVLYIAYFSHVKVEEEVEQVQASKKDSKKK